MQKKECGARSKFTDELRDIIEEKLTATWSSEQIIGSLFQGKLAFKTIYRWLYSGKLRVTLQVLRQKGKRQAPRETRGRFNVGTSIQQRPKEIKTRGNVWPLGIRYCCFSARYERMYGDVR